MKMRSFRGPHGTNSRRRARRGTVMEGGRSSAIEPVETRIPFG